MVGLDVPPFWSTAVATFRVSAKEGWCRTFDLLLTGGIGTKENGKKRLGLEGSVPWAGLVPGFSEM